MKPRLGRSLSLLSQLTLWRALAAFFALLSLFLAIRREGPLEARPMPALASKILGASTGSNPQGGLLAPPPNAVTTSQLPKNDASTLVLQSAARELRQPTNYRRIRQQQVLNVFGDWIGDIDLPADTKTRVKEILVERAQRVADVKTAAVQNGITDTNLVGQLTSKNTEELDQRIEGMIGAANVADYRGLLSSQSEMLLYRIQLRADFEFADMQLTTAQTLQLLAAQKEASREAAELPASDPLAAEGFGRAAISVIRKAESIMSPAQLKIVKDYYRARLEMNSDLKR